MPLSPPPPRPSQEKTQSKFLAHPRLGRAAGIDGFMGVAVKENPTQCVVSLDFP